MIQRPTIRLGWRACGDVARAEFRPPRSWIFVRHRRWTPRSEGALNDVGRVTARREIAP